MSAPLPETGSKAAATRDHILAALNAGAPASLLVPVLPITAMPLGSDPKTLGKAPAHYNERSGAWTGASGWQRGTSLAQLTSDGRHGANVGLLCGVPAGGLTFYLFDLDVQFLIGKSNAGVIAQVVCDTCETLLSSALDDLPFWVRKTHQYRGMVAVAVRAEAPVGSKQVRQVYLKDRLILKLELLACGQQGVIGGEHSAGPITWRPFGRPSEESRTISFAPDAIPRLDSFEHVVDVLDALCGGLSNWHRDIQIESRGSRTTTDLSSNQEDVFEVPAGDAPPGGSAQAIDVLNRMYNGLDVSRETYVQVMLSVVGVIRALERQSKLDSAGSAGIRHAAIEFATRWGGPTTFEAEAAKFDDDFMNVRVLYGGWRTLLGLAQRLTPDLAEAFRSEDAQYDFWGVPLPPGSGIAESMILNPEAPQESARAFLAQRHMQGGLPTLHHQNASFYHWASSHYVEVPPEEMRGRIWKFLGEAERFSGKKAVPFNPDRAKVGNVLEALAAETQLPSHVRPPAWLDAEAHPPPGEIVVCRNGLLHVATRELAPHSAAFFSVNALAFDYDPAVAEPKLWLEFLGQIWGTDSASIETLQEMFGLLLTGETRFQKAFLMVGPKRSGKGTIARVLTQLLGEANVCQPTLSGLGRDFGLQPLIGKRLAVIADARLGGKADQHVIAERILAITGEDRQTIDRKYKEAWSGHLETRFLVISNELPRLADVSGALPSRFITMVLQNSFFGREDLGLTERLTEELPGILLWALAGLARLKARGYFVPPPSAAEAHGEMEDLASPISAFLRERCIVGAGRTVVCADLFNEWLDWCRDANRTHAGTKETFGRDLHAAVPHVKTIQPRADDNTRRRCYEGLDIKPATL